MYRKMNGLNRWAAQRGLAAIEFAILLPFMIVFLYGVFAYAIISAYQVSLNAMASDSARAAVQVYTSGLDDPLGAAGTRIGELLGSSWMPGADGCEGNALTRDGDLLHVCLSVPRPIRPISLAGFSLPQVDETLYGRASVSLGNNE